MKPPWEDTFTKLIPTVRHRLRPRISPPCLTLFSCPDPCICLSCKDAIKNLPSPIPLGRPDTQARTHVTSTQRHDDHDGNENDKGQQQLCTCITLFCTFLGQSLHDYNVKLLYVLSRTGTKTTTFFSFPELCCGPLEFNSKKNCQHLTN